ncbi:hypothetical protein PT277_03625 [Acetobacteraceae bacterium ESL0709]|nr:hypothetical protein [Acetobacteraceae bacterium ESL0697]MDF7677790.1 hypothetical protein [Acetobacteraceae bacterium ESL0709]
MTTSSLFHFPVTRRLFGRLTLASFACMGLIHTPAAHARDELKEAPVPAQIKTEQAVSGTLSPLLASLPDGTLYSLDGTGHIVRLDTQTGALQPPLPGLPAFSALAGNRNGLWGVTQGATPELCNISPDGRIKSRTPLQKAVTSTSHIPALQVGNDFAYISDEGAPALIVVDLRTNIVRRLMINFPSLIAETPYKRNGQIERNAKGQRLSVGNVRYLALSQDGKRLFYQTPPGPFFMIETVLLNDPTTSATELLEAMVKWRNSYCLGGLAITPENTLYMIDVEHGDLIEVPYKQLPLRLAHDMRLTQAVDMAFIPPQGTAQAKLAILTGTGNDTETTDKMSAPLKLLTIDLP